MCTPKCILARRGGKHDQEHLYKSLIAEERETYRPIVFLRCLHVVLGRGEHSLDLIIVSLKEPDRFDRNFMAL